jgi:hypothetical protein
MHACNRNYKPRRQSGLHLQTLAAASMHAYCIGVAGVTDRDFKSRNACNVSNIYLRVRTRLLDAPSKKLAAHFSDEFRPSLPVVVDIKLQLKSSSVWAFKKFERTSSQQLTTCGHLLSSVGGESPQSSRPCTEIHDAIFRCV